MKKWCLSCVIRGFQMEAAAWSPCSLIRRPRAWTLMPAVLARLRAAEPSCCCWGCRWCGTRSSQLPGIYSNKVKAYVHPESCPPELTAALLRCLQYVNGYNWCTCAMGYGTKTKTRGWSSLEKTWGELKSLLGSKRSLSDGYCKMSTIWHFWERPSHRDSKRVSQSFAGPQGQGWDEQEVELNPHISNNVSMLLHPL